MISVWQRVKDSPMWLRVVPFIVFAGLTALQGRFGEESKFWLYLAKVIVGAIIVWTVWPLISEMRWKFSWEGVIVGVFVFVVWVGLDPFYPKWSATSHWSPHDHFGTDTTLAWLFIVVRMIGVTLVVPPIEEVFYRSFLYRYLVQPEFDKIALGHFAWTPLVVSSMVFGLVHFEWLAGIMSGLAFQLLVIRKRRLGDAMTAHAIANLLLGLCVVVMGMWFYW